jgi:hypothetical protein
MPYVAEAGTVRKNHRMIGNHDMNRSSSNKALRLSVAGFALLAAWQGGFTASSAWAQTPPPPPPSASPPATPAAPPTSPLTAPSLAGPLALSTTPYNFDAAGLGNVYVSGVLSGLGLFQSDAVAGDKNNNVDLSNGMAIIQKIDGLVQFYAQAGVYSLPALGVNYHTTQMMSKAVNDYYSAFPEGYLKLVPTDTFSVEGGKLPSLIGDEYTFTFENMNIERGLLWSLEPAISQGVQANLTTGPVAWAVSVNDGLYSGSFNWVSGSATWTINSANTLAVAAGGNFSTHNASTIVSPFALQNEDIVNLIYTYNAAPWTISPYFQYTSNQHNTALGLGTKDGSTWGGAILANYNINDTWNLAGRVEFEDSSGSATDGTVNILGFGAGSSAWSVTVTPTWQNGIYFARAEGSYVGLSSITPGSGFGRGGGSTSQERLVLEAGILF